MRSRRLSVLATREELEVLTSFVWPPIPDRQFDWFATTSDFECDWSDAEERWTKTGEAGHGETEAQAIADLLEQVEMRGAE